MSGAGTSRLRSGPHLLRQALTHGYVGFEEIADNLGNIVSDDTLLGSLCERTHLITGAHFRKGARC